MSIRRSRISNRWLGILALGIALGISSLWIAQHSQHLRASIGDHPEFAGLIDQSGEHFDPHVLDGQYRLIYFGFTQCADECHVPVAKLVLALQDIGALADRVQAIYITTDPEHDTPAILNFYLAHFGAPLIGLTGSPRAVLHVADTFGVRTRGAGTMFGREYTQQYFLLAPNGALILRIPVTAEPEKLADQLRTLLDTLAT